MSSAKLDRDAATIIRHQPMAHAPWQLFYRHVRFRGAVDRFTNAVYELNIDHYSDDDLNKLEETITSVIKVVEVHTSRLGSYIEDNEDRRYFKAIIDRLGIAREGLSEGLPPDPAKRPNEDQLLDRLATMLTRPA